MQNLKEIEIAKIISPYNSRSKFKEDEVSSLMQSIKEQGLLQPIGLIEKKDKYEIIFGNRRLEACKKLGLKYIPAIVSDVEISEIDMILKNATENIHRKNISPIELGKLSLDLKEKYGMSAGEIATALSITVSKVKNSIELIHRVPKHIQSMIGCYNTGSQNTNKNGLIPPTIINTIYTSRLTKNEMNELTEYCRKEEFNTAKIQQIIRLVKGGLSVKKAIDFTNDMSFITIELIVNKKEMDKIKNTKLSISKYIALIVNGKLPPNPEFIIINE